jgi:hypothetical protein
MNGGVRLPAPGSFSSGGRVSEQLSGLRSAVESIVPGDARISFRFEDRLRINIDVRDLRDVARAETLLPTLAHGIFFNVQRALADQSFRHRLTAEVQQ